MFEFTASGHEKKKKSCQVIFGFTTGQLQIQYCKRQWWIETSNLHTKENETFFFLHSKCTACFISTSRFELLRKSKCTACVDKGSQQAQQDPTDQQERRGITSKPGFIQEGTVLYACHVWTLHRAGL